MNIYRYIVLIGIMFLIPALAISQTRKVNIGKKKYIVTSGDTTLIVNPTGKWADDPDSRFLLERKGRVIDSLFQEINPRYHTLEEAALDINNLLNEVEKNKAKDTENKGLSFKISQEMIKNNDKERIARHIADSILQNNKMSVEDFASIHIGYGDKPTYFINGQMVNQEIVNYLLPTDIISRSIKTMNTASGNPNGEIWYQITDQAMDRINSQIVLKDSKVNPQIFDGLPTSNKKKGDLKIENTEIEATELEYDMFQPNPYQEIEEEVIEETVIPSDNKKERNTLIEEKTNKESLNRKKEEEKKLNEYRILLEKQKNTEKKNKRAEKNKKQKTKNIPQVILDNKPEDKNIENPVIILKEKEEPAIIEYDMSMPNPFENEDVKMIVEPKIENKKEEKKKKGEKGTNAIIKEFRDNAKDKQEPTIITEYEHDMSQPEPTVISKKIQEENISVNNVSGESNMNTKSAKEIKKELKKELNIK